MKGSFGEVEKRGMFCLLLACLGSGCVSSRDQSPTRDHAYIDYWPAPKDSTKLRLAVKDLIDMKGVVTTAGSEYRAKNAAPATKDAECLKIARRRNVQIVGKTNLSEFALRGSGMNDYYGTPVNPLDHGCIPGGSSSGSAVAVADGTADVAIGTDTCGSIRVPAACCGIAGLKTTFGLISTKGVFPISPKHMDTIGPMAKDIPHLVEGMDLLQEGFAVKYKAVVSAQPDAKRIKVARLYLDGTDPAIDKAIDDAIAAAGFDVVRLVHKDSTMWDKAESDGQTLARIDAWRSTGDYLSKKEIQRVTKTIIWSGKIASEDKYSEVLLNQSALRHELHRVFEKEDFIILPALKSVPLKKPFLGSNILFELRVLNLQETEPLNLLGNPALVVPVPLKGRSVPVTGIQIVGRNNSEAALLNAGRLIEAQFPPSTHQKHFTLSHLFHLGGA